MTPPSQSDDDYDTNPKRYESSKDKEDLVQTLSNLTESDIAAVLKRLNIKIVKQEARKRDQDADKADTTDGSPARFSCATTSNILPSCYMKVSTGLTLRSAFRTGSELGDVKIIIPKIYRGKKLQDQQKTKKMSQVLCPPRLQAAKLPRSFPSLTASRTILLKTPPNGVPPSRRFTITQ